jgi:hypothetical protein
MFNTLEFYADNEFQFKFNEYLMNRFNKNEEHVLGVYVDLDIIRDKIGDNI